MTAPFHHHQPVAGMGPGQKHIQLFTEWRGHQIEAAPHQQYRHLQTDQPLAGPQQAAESVEGHNPGNWSLPDAGLGGEALGQLALEQP